MSGKTKGISRREFLKYAGAGSLSLALTVGATSIPIFAKDELTFWSCTAAENPETAKAVAGIVKSFEDATGVSVNLEKVSYDVLRQKLLAAVKAGNPPDIAEAGTLGLKFAFEGKVVNLKPYLEDNKELLDDLHPGVKQAMKAKDGKLWWGVPARCTTNAWGGRIDLLNDAGYKAEDLTNWSKVLEAMQATTNPDKNVFGMAIYGVPWDLEQYWGMAKTFVEEPGQDPFLTKTSSGWHSNMLNYRLKGMTRWYVDLLRYFKVAHPKSPSLSDEEAAILLCRGEVVQLTQIGGRRYRLNCPALYQYKEKTPIITAWVMPKLTKSLGDASPDRYPELVGQEGYHGAHMWVYEQGQCVFNKDKAELGAKFIAHWCKPEHARAIGLSYGCAPLISLTALKQAADDPEFGPIAQAMATQALDYAENVTPTGWPIPITNTIRWDIINENISKAVAGDLTSDEALEKANEEINDLLKKEGWYG